MNHPLLSFFGFNGTEDMAAHVYHPKGGRSLFCKPCKRWYGDYDFADSKAKISKIPKDAYYEGSPEVPIGPDWPEAIAVLAEPPLLREDVVEIMRESGITGFIPHSVELEINDGKKLTHPVPKYFHIEITGKVDLVLPGTEVVICPTCCCRTDRNWGTKLMLPVMESWSGHDLVGTSNFRTGLKFTTRKLIDLARANQWSSFRFGEWIPHVTVRYLDVHDWFSDVEIRIRKKYPNQFVLPTP